MRIVFVGGVHGVGKSTCCQKASERSGLPLHTASALIKAERQSSIVAGSKKVVDAIENQELLIRGVHNLRKAGNKRIILDGHFTLLESTVGIIKVEINVFIKLGLEKIVVLHDDPASICNRLQERDKQDWSISMVGAHQEAEIQQAYIVASILNIPICTLAPFDVDGLIRAGGLCRSFPS